MRTGAPIRKSRPSRRSLEFAHKMIREKIDSEGKYQPEAFYQLTGRQLREYLAYAKDEGIAEQRATCDAVERGGKAVGS